jgi:hypothetical protein
LKIALDDVFVYEFKGTGSERFEGRNVEEY